MQVQSSISVFRHDKTLVDYDGFHLMDLKQQKTIIVTSGVHVTLKSRMTASMRSWNPCCPRQSPQRSQFILIRWGVEMQHHLIEGV